MNPSTPRRYDWLSQFFHWATALAVVAAYVVEPDGFKRLLRQGLDPAASSSVLWHESLGILVLVLTLLRLLWLALRPAPPQFKMAGWTQRAARLTHLALWVLVLLTPLAALLMLAGKDAPLTLLGGLRLQELPWIAHSALSRLLDWGDVHEVLGNALLLVAGAHAAAALYHQFVLGDGVLTAMLPGRRRG